MNRSDTWVGDVLSQPGDDQPRLRQQVSTWSSETSRAYLHSLSGPSGKGRQRFVHSLPVHNVDPRTGGARISLGVCVRSQIHGRKLEGLALR